MSVKGNGKCGCDHTFIGRSLDRYIFWPFAVIVLLETGMYFDGVWSKLRTNDRGISFSSIFLTMLCKYAFSSSLQRASGIETLPVVVKLLTNFILLNKPCALLDSSKSIWFRFISGYRLIKALATDMAMVLLTTPPRAQAAEDERRVLHFKL